jgi:hypothetical protein
LEELSDEIQSLHFAFKKSYMVQGNNLREYYFLVATATPKNTNRGIPYPNAVAIYKIAVALACDPTPPISQISTTFTRPFNIHRIYIPGMLAGALVMKKVHFPISRHLVASFSKSHISPIGHPQSANKLSCKYSFSGTGHASKVGESPITPAK